MATKVGTTGALPAVPAGAGVLGQGIKYPLEYDANTGRLKLSSGPQKVLEGVQSIGVTQPGERPMQPDYGANTGLFEPVNDPQRYEVDFRRCVAEHEPRVSDLEVNINQGTDGQQMVEVKAIVINEATPRTLTFPYFSKE